jgi:hypothetical protein
MDSTFKKVDIERGIYEETKTDIRVEPVSLAHIRKMIVERQEKRVALCEELDKEITYWQAKEAAIKKVTGFEEPTKAPDAPEEAPEE